MNTIHEFFQDKDGKWVIGQFPNSLILLWVIFAIITILVPDGQLHDGLQLTKSSVLFVWAYLELVDGDSRFRQVLGPIVLFAILYGYFT